MVKEKKSTEKVFSKLKDDIKGAKRRIKYSKDFEKEVRTIVSRLHVIADKNLGLSSFRKDKLPFRLSVNFYQEQGEKHFESEGFNPSNDFSYDIEELEDVLFNRLKIPLEICEQVVDDALFELEQFDEVQKPTVKTKTTKPKVVKVPKIESKPTKAPIITKPKEKKFDKKPSIGYIKLPIPFTDIKIEINLRELGIFLLGMFAGIIILISAILGIDFISGL